MASDELVALGVIGRTHGVRGDVTARLHNPDSEALDAVKRVTLRRGTETRELRIEMARPKGDAGLILHFEGVNTVELAEALKGSELCVPRAALPVTRENEWYQIDLIGLRAEDAAGAVLGEVIAVRDYPTVDCLVVRSEDGVREVPMGQPYLVSVDVAGGRVVMGEWGDLDVEIDKP